MTVTPGFSSKFVVPLLSCIGTSVVLVFVYFAPDFRGHRLRLAVPLVLPYTVVLLLWDTRFNRVTLGIALGTGISYAIPGFLLSAIALIFGGVGSSTSFQGQLQLFEIILFSALAAAIVVLSIRTLEKFSKEFFLGTILAFAYVMWAGIIAYRIAASGPL